MSEAAKAKPQVGTVVWQDLTVDNAEQVQEFYAKVMGWRVEPVDMGGYNDYSMVRPDGGPAGGVCHRRGTNSKFPPQWIVYFQVADLDASIAACKESGGEVVDGPRAYGEQRYCILRDPAGVVFAIAQ